MEDNFTEDSQVNESPTEQETVVAEQTVADLHQDKPKTEKPKVVPMQRLEKEIAKRKALEDKLKEYEVVDQDDEDDEPEVKKLAHKLEQIENEQRSEKLEATFMQHLNGALENHPEYKDVVNVEVIKTLAFNPLNANKTYRELLEMAYGNAVTGRRTIETTTLRGGAKDTKLDMARAKTDTAYRHEVLADPELKKQYNEGLTDRVFR